MRTLKFLLPLLMVGCTSPIPQPAGFYSPDTDNPTVQCPEDTNLAAYAFFCDSQGGISGCLVGTDPAMCDQATSTRHDCDCDNLTTCHSYINASGAGLVGCVK